MFGDRCVRFGNFIELLLVSSRLRFAVLPRRHLASQKIFPTKRPTKGIHALNYEKLQQQRLEEAQRTVLILHPTHSSPVVDLCHHFGHIRNAISFRHNVKNYTLVEYRDDSSIDNVLASCRQFPNIDRVPVQSRLLYYHAGRDRFSGAGRRTFQVDHKAFIDNYRLNVLTELALQKCSSLEQQMWMLYDKLVMSDLDIRLRYFLCCDLESSLRKLLPDVIVRPFGSSVNGFGRYDCDLDLVINLDSKAQQNNHHGNDTSLKRQDGLYFLSKLRLGDDRRFVQRTLEVIAGLLQCILPQFVNVQRILHARVPIVKFSHVATGIDCDVCLENESAVLMSEIMYYLCQLDASTRSRSSNSANSLSSDTRQRISPLVFVVRQWACSAGVTGAMPGVGFSNFMLTVLVVFFLQTRRMPVLPPLRTLKTTSSGPAKLLSEDISLPNRPISTLNNSQSLDELLMEFFEFFADFNFSEHGVSVVNGSVVEKVDPSAPVYIENPLERELNVSKNVLEEHLQTFQMQCRLARDALRQCSTVPQSRQRGDAWGLLGILKTDDQLLLTEDLPQTQASDEGGEHVSVASASQDGVVDLDSVDQPPQPQTVGVIDIHEVLRGENDADDKVADNVSTRTL